MGIEPTSRAWEARVIAIIRRPQICSFVEGNLSCNMHKSKVWVQLCVALIVCPFYNFIKKFLISIIHYFNSTIFLVCMYSPACI